MDDLISRQMAIEVADAVWVVTGDKNVAKVWDQIKDLPSAERHGRWIMHIDDLFPAESTMECSQCHEEQPLECDDNYCPNCGAKMDEEENK